MKKIILPLALIFSNSIFATGTAGGGGLIAIVDDQSTLDSMESLELDAEKFDSAFLEALTEESLKVRVGDDILKLPATHFSFKDKILSVRNPSNGMDILIHKSPKVLGVSTKSDSASIQD